MKQNMYNCMNNSNGFQTKVWGAPMWLNLHIMSLNYTPDKKQGYKQFLNSLKYTLPCGACRTNYTRILENVLPLDESVFKSRRSMSFWMFKLHNQVQQDIYNKTQNPYDIPKFTNSKDDFKTAMALYEPFRAKCVKNASGCVIPLKGSRKRTRIVITKYSKPRRKDPIFNILE